MLWKCWVINFPLYFRGKIGGKEDTWHIREAGASIQLCSEAIQHPLPFTCRCLLWNPRILSPPIANDEILVSSVIELSHDGPPDLEYKESVEGTRFTVALLHSAPNLEGYEVVIKQLTDQENNEWKELKTENTWHGSGTIMLLWNASVNNLLNYILRLPFFTVTNVSIWAIVHLPSHNPKLTRACNLNLAVDYYWLRGGVGVHWFRYWCWSLQCMTSELHS